MATSNTSRGMAPSDRRLRANFRRAAKPYTRFYGPFLIRQKHLPSPPTSPTASFALLRTDFETEEPGPSMSCGSPHDGSQVDTTPASGTAQHEDRVAVGVPFKKDLDKPSRTIADLTKPFPRPEGQLSKPGAGGYSLHILKTTYGWTEVDYTRIQRRLQHMSRTHFDTKLTFARQESNDIHRFVNEAVIAFPVLADYVDAWPARDFATMYLKNSSAEYRAAEKRATSTQGAETKRHDPAKWNGPRTVLSHPSVDQDGLIAKNQSHSAKPDIPARVDPGLPLTHDLATGAFRVPQGQPLSLLLSHFFHPLLPSIAFLYRAHGVAYDGRSCSHIDNTRRDMDRYRRAFQFSSPSLTRPVNCLAFTSDGSLLAVCSDDHVIHIISTESKGKVFVTVRTYGGPMASAVWFADGSGGHWLATGGHQGYVRLLHVKLDGKKLAVIDDTAPLTLGDDEIVDLVVDPSSRHVAAVGLHRLFVLAIEYIAQAPLRLVEMYPQQGHPKEESRLSGAAFCDAGNTLIVSHLDARIIRLYASDPWSVMHDLHVTFKPISLSWVPEQRCLLVYCIDTAHVRVVGISDGQLIYRRILEIPHPDRGGYCKQVRSAHHGRFALCGSDIGCFLCWDISSGASVQSPLVCGRGRGDVGIQGGYPGLQVIATCSSSGGDHQLAGSCHAFPPTINVWKDDMVSRHGSAPNHHVIYTLSVLSILILSLAYSFRLIPHMEDAVSSILRTLGLPFCLEFSVYANPRCIRIRTA
ncbi:unnamed protein product [Peniophora sp. CBMAI 1063]|nr:unnamed protein product [Peniophora sp. CBMAI 1063]